MSLLRTFSARVNKLIHQKFQEKPVMMMVITIPPLVLTIGETQKHICDLPDGIYQWVQNITCMKEFGTYSSPR